MKQVCTVCLVEHDKKQSARYCSNACRQAAYRVRKNIQATSKRHRIGKLRRQGSRVKPAGELIDDSTQAAALLLEQGLQSDHAAHYHALQTVARYALRCTQVMERHHPWLKSTGEKTRPVNFV